MDLDSATALASFVATFVETFVGTAQGDKGDARQAFPNALSAPLVNGGGQAVFPAAGLVPGAHGGVLGVGGGGATGAEQSGCNEEKSEK